MELKRLLEIEENLISEEFRAEFERLFNETYAIGYESVRLNSSSRLSSLVDNISEKIHASIILGLGIQFLKSRNSKLSDKELLEAYVFPDNVSPIFIDDIDGSSIPDLCESFHVKYLNTHIEPTTKGLTRIKSKANIIEKGAVYTLPQIVDDIVASAINNYAKSREITDTIHVLDFACGTGRFYICSVKQLSRELNSSESDIALKNVYALDLDCNAVNVTRIKALSLFTEITANIINTIATNIKWRNGLMFENLMNGDDMPLRHSDFNGLVDSGFDIIVSNPPYLVLKNSKRGGTEESAMYFKNLVDYFKTSGDYIFSIEGMLNLYQLSIERMLAMLKAEGELGVICPSSLFADVSATKLRKHMLNNNNVRSIRYYAEDDLIFENVLQATVIFQLQKSGKTSSIVVNDGHNSFEVDVNLVKELFPDKMEIPLISKPEWETLRHLSTFTKMKDIKSIRNKRGELDMTLGKRYITKDKTKYRLVRGNMIAQEGIRDINKEYVQEEFINQKSSDFIDNDFGKRRLVCQQISNAGQAKRLKFVFCEENDILGNSCNYLSSDEDTLKKLNIIMNSSLLNWRFKVTSSNNHINNYELGELPMPDLDEIDPNIKFATQNELDDYVNSLYKINTTVENV